MQDLWIDLRDLGGTESQICSSEENEEECACVVVSGLSNRRGIGGC